MKNKLFIIPLFFIGCVQYTYLGTSKKSYPINFDDVQVFESEKDLPAEYEKVAILILKNVDRFKFDEAKEKASNIGCNGVLMRSYDKASFLERTLTLNGDEAEFIAIRFKINGQYPSKRTKVIVRGDDAY